ncbi:MAG: SusC/RagA family TonB-linked outer membrane protein [Bacteroidales bacterium]|nr:SusC/RagA family TonB-linked outer membrane protein [Bacteroidales bacterium]
MKKVVSFLLFMALGTLTLFGQARAVTGTVTGADDGAPLPGVSVFVQGTSLGTITDMEGFYDIDVPQSSNVMVFSFVGMLTQEIAIDGQTVIDVVLVPTSLELDEVVVTALGVSREKKSLGYAVQEMDGDDVNKVKSDNIVNALSGKIAGVQVKVANNIGGSSNILIRGSSSLTQNNQALFVVDGVPISNAMTNKDFGAQSQGRQAYDYGNAVSDLNLDDVESISVLKGAAATALYGSRAANGVIIITSKKGKPGAKLGVTVNSNVTIGIIDPTTFPKYQDQYGGGYDPAWHNSDMGGLDWDDIDGDGLEDTDKYLVPYYDDASRGGPLDGTLVWQYDAWIPESENYMTPTPYLGAENGPLEFFENSVSLTNSIDISGGSDKATYRMAYANKDVKGIYPNSQLKRNNFSFSGSYNVLENVKVSTSANFINSYTRGRNSTGYSGNIMGMFRQWWQVNVDLLQQKELYEATGRNLTWNPNAWNDPVPIFWDNPYWTVNHNYPEDVRTRLIGFVQADWKITDYLSLMGRISADSYRDLQEEKRAVGSTSAEFGTGFPRQEVTSGYARFDRTFMETNVDFLLNFNKDLSESINLTALVGTNIRRRNIESVFAATNGGLAVPGLYSLNNSVAPMLPPDERLDQIGVNGIFGSMSLGFSNLFYLDATLRNDVSSTLPLENNSYYYPSVSGSFLFNYLIDADWLQLGKVRVNYAEVGNSAPSRSILDTYDGMAPFSGNTMVSVNPTKNNADLLPEKTKSMEAGLEMRMFQSRVGLDFAVYKTNTINQLMPVDVSFATGYQRTWVNAGEIENKGIELAAFVTPVRSMNFSWEISVNWAKNVNQVISLFTDEAGNEVQNLVIGDLQAVKINARVGEPYGTITGRNYVFHENGEPIVASSGLYERTATSDQVLGNVNPDWIGGINNSFRYKDFSFSFLIDWQQGGSIFSLDNWYGIGTGLYEETAGNNDLGNPQRDPVDGENGGGIILPGVLEDGTPNDIRIESDIFAEGWVRSPHARFVYDATYIKLRELVLTYDLPQELMNRTPLYGASISFVGSNLWIIKKNLPHADPEASQGAGNIQGWQSGVMPTTRNFGFSLNLQF